MVQNVTLLDGSTFDLLVVGGGINGVGIARDAVGRGLSVLLVERDDLAAHTSSASTKLIHGGLRYLEYYEFRLVRESLQERERLIRIAPHISWPLRFVLPQPEGGRPGWMIRIGLWLYDHLGGRQSLPASQGVDLADPRWGAGLKPGLKRGFAYSDAWVDDARLVVLNAIDAAERGATILTGTAMTGARVEGDAWRVALAPNPARARPGIAAPVEVQARAIVNAAGPWAGHLLDGVDGVSREGGVTLVKGSHIVVPQLYPGAHAFILQQQDGRIVFTIPYEHRYTLIGTTDVLVGADQRDRPEISPEETDYLCAAVNRYFAREIGPDDVVRSYSGVRPLYDDGTADAKAITRDYVLQLGRKTGPQVLSVLGGKLTTYRRLAEHALENLQPWLSGSGQGWTDTAPLPGGDLPPGSFADFLAQCRQRWPFLPAAVAERLAHAYGTRIERIIGTATDWAGLGEDFGQGLTAAEVAYLCDHEWACDSDDILWRRTKLGLGADPALARRLAEWLAANR
ncbi:glycerol-3-phosphate dehydrogenase [Novosphingobium piscinae]|uniref:Glycerol-3-phosphate dehydrogenase n=1 Tax=Novosphingobium piscinae TaxID=1507448 RepID=A0A7X1FXH3_9SPHN|nr:glycerol-3-phosphate dehydrogenase [Novosphingobium piscinae]MBC2668800.1 glycerol-3-phosphate dehydrogenase [Novosphingobium piscinae]